VETSSDQHTTRSADRRVVTVEIYSDVVCPWCYIGKRRFEHGLRLLDRDDLGVDFDVLFRPFQLDPTAAPGVSGPVVDAYARKFGGPERAAEIIDHVTRVAADSGVYFRMELAQRANTLLAHRLIWLAEQPGSPVPQEAMKERLLHAYFVDGVHIGDPDALAECAAEVGFDRDAVAEFLASDRGVPEVAAMLDDAREQGITAVPTYVFDGAWAVPGAQEPEMFAQILRKMAAKVTASVGSTIDDHAAVDG
jgi:predicted DsbA family dithiol-disulfide isomerase